MQEIFSNGLQKAHNLLQELNSPTINWQRDSEHLVDLYDQYPSEIIDSAHLMLWPIVNDINLTVDTGLNQVVT